MIRERMKMSTLYPSQLLYLYLKRPLKNPVARYRKDGPGKKDVKMST